MSLKHHMFLSRHFSTFVTVFHCMCDWERSCVKNSVVQNNFQKSHWMSLTCGDTLLPFSFQKCFERWAWPQIRSRTATRQRSWMAPLESDFALRNKHQQKHWHFQLKINSCQMSCRWESSKRPPLAQPIPCRSFGRQQIQSKQSMASTTMMTSLEADKIGASVAPGKKHHNRVRVDGANVLSVWLHPQKIQKGSSSGHASSLASSCWAVTHSS